MQRLVAILMCLLTLSAFGQPVAKYQVATILTVAPHASKADSGTDSTSYEVSLQVGNKVYVVLYTAPPGTETVKYIAGRQVLVLVGQKTITYNNLLGQSLEVPILRQGPARAETK